MSDIFNSILSLLSASFLGIFLIVMLGNSSYIKKLSPVGFVLIKVGLSAMICGHLMTALLPYEEIYNTILRGGEALLFGWASIFHYKKFNK